MLSSKPTSAAAVAGFALGCLLVAVTIGCYAAMRLFLPSDLWGDPASEYGLSQPQTALLLFAMLVLPHARNPHRPVRYDRTYTFGFGPTGGLCIPERAVFRAGHYFSALLTHGLTAFYAGAFAGSGVCGIRPWGCSTSFTLALTAHVTHNPILLLLLLQLFPSARIITAAGPQRAQVLDSLTAARVGQDGPQNGHIPLHIVVPNPQQDGDRTLLTSALRIPAALIPGSYTSLSSAGSHDHRQLSANCDLTGRANAGHSRLVDSTLLTTVALARAAVYIIERASA